MDARRFNDTAKIVGTAIGILGLFGPVLMKPHASFGELLADLMAQVPGAIGAYLAGFGTRAKGTEYQDVADAKAVAKVAASIMPPPIPVAAPDTTKPNP
jgi:hypothetical protein